MSQSSRRSRRVVAGGVYRLGEEPHDDLSALTAEERLAIVAELTLRAWKLTGRPFPSYERDTMPIVIRRLA